MSDTMLAAGTKTASRTSPVSGRLDWKSDGADWPNRDASCFISAGGVDWHVQRMGVSGPRLLLVHGTAASTHSWAGLAPLLARRFRIVAPDLPGHGFSSRGLGPAGGPDSSVSMTGMASRVSELLKVLDFAPDIVIGHSAGAAVLARMCLNRVIAPGLLISINGALLPFGSIGRYMLPAMARLMFQNSFVPWVFARQAQDSANVERLIRGTGSKLAPADLDFYVRLFRSQTHVEAALAMMANWDLAELEHELPKLGTPLVLVATSEDLSVPPEKAAMVKRLVPGAEVLYLRGLGHLAHEEDPGRIAQLVFDEAEKHGLLSPVPGKADPAGE